MEEEILVFAKGFVLREANPHVIFVRDVFTGQIIHTDACLIDGRHPKADDYMPREMLVSSGWPDN